MEEWRTVEEYPNYEVSNLGNVRRARTGRALKAFVNDSGYLRVNLSPTPNEKAKAVLVHRIVTRAFHGRPVGERNLVDHIDRNKLNNRAENLHWVNWKENLENTHWFSGRACRHCGQSPKRRKRGPERGPGGSPSPIS